MAVKTSMLVAAGMLLAACTADAAVLCTTKSGTVKLRPTACKRKETKVDPAAVGLPLANVVDVPNFNVGNLDILTEDSVDQARVFWLNRFQDAAVWGLDEAVLVDFGIRREAPDQTDIRAFRRLNRADAPVVAVMDVANIEARPLAAQPARS